MVSRDTAVKIERRLHAAGVALPADVREGLGTYFGLIAKWNRKLNLTALQLEPASSEAVDRLIVEPAAAARVITSTDSLLVDLGSGGGSPAIPLKVCAPWLRLSMVEVKARKAAFLRDVTRQMGLEGTQVSNISFEDLAVSGDFLGQADLVSVRAVRADEELWRLIGNLLKPGGRVLWFHSAGSGSSSPTASLKSVSSVPLPGAARLVVLQRP